MHGLCPRALVDLPAVQTVVLGSGFWFRTICPDGSINQPSEQMSDSFWRSWRSWRRPPPAPWALLVPAPSSCLCSGLFDPLMFSLKAPCSPSPVCCHLLIQLFMSFWFLSSSSSHPPELTYVYLLRAPASRSRWWWRAASASSTSTVGGGSPPDS